MKKELLSSFLVMLVFLVGAAVEFIRGKTVLAVIGLVLGVLYAVFTLIGYIKEKKNLNGSASQESVS